MLSKIRFVAILALLITVAAVSSAGAKVKCNGCFNCEQLVNLRYRTVFYASNDGAGEYLAMPFMIGGNMETGYMYWYCLCTNYDENWMCDHTGQMAPSTEHHDRAWHQPGYCIFVHGPNGPRWWDPDTCVDQGCLGSGGPPPGSTVEDHE